MGAFSIWHWLIVLVVVLVLFGGGGKISRLMGDFGKGLKSFKKGMKEEEPIDPDNDSQKVLNADTGDVKTSESTENKAANT